ncbi:hypothetical protein [Phenylobacterium sp.]|uniref:hypothetical protein n=1 Tax=Phenylobacterium sp. TaxID=1871053 RepID=UPI00286A4E2B|nr:hypothetical protein [Phenylobacterium sp.]
MTQADDHLRGLFASDAPDARDLTFSTAVMERVMRRRFQEDVALLSGASVLGAGALWVLWPVLQPVLVSLSQGFAPLVSALAVVLCIQIILNGRPVSATGLES